MAQRTAQHSRILARVRRKAAPWMRPPAAAATSAARPGRQGSARGRGWIVAAALLAAGFVALTLTHVGGDALTQRVDDIGQIFAALSAAAGCAIAARHLRGRDRVAWSLVGSGCAMWAGGEVMWCFYELVMRVQVPFPSAADIGYLGAVPLIVAGLLTFPQIRSAAARFRTMVDGMIICTSLLAISWTTVLGAVYSSGADSTLAMVIGLAYPLGDVVIITMVLLMATRARARTRAPLLLLAAGVAASAVADSGFAYLTAAGTYSSGNVIDSGWFIGFMLVGLAGLRASMGRGQLAAHEPLPSALRLTAPYIPVAMAAGLCVWRVATHQNFGVVLVVLVSLLITLVLIRQFLTLADNAGLARRLGHDSLTGLPNRDLLRQRIGEALAVSRSGETSCSVLFVDLDDFKEVNDRWGHAAGDHVLTIVGRRMQSCVRASDVVARISGDEFAVLLEEAGPLDNVMGVAHRILRSFEEPAAVDDVSIPIRATVGLVTGVTSSTNADELLHHADVAMYVGKTTGKSQLVRYEETMEVAIDQRVQWRTELDAALAAGQFVLHYQPIIELATKRVIGAEALLRWQHPRFGLLPPVRFIADLERSGLIVDVGAWVLMEATRQMKEWQTITGETPFVTVNISNVQVRRGHLEDTVKAAITASALPPESLILELTESGLIESTDAVRTQLQRLREFGVRLALDDFGTGYSSLTYLQSFNVDMLKVDKSFVDAADGAAVAPLTEAIVHLGKALKLTTLVEGIESEEQHASLDAVGCELAQGYLYSRPLAPSAFKNELTRRPHPDAAPVAV